MIHKVSTPTLFVDRSIAMTNIQRMVDKARANHIQLRPHFKTHQSHVVGRWYRAFDIHCITVSSISMAIYFARDGWQDITVAFPLNILEIDKINTIPETVRLNLVVENLVAVEALQFKLKRPVNLFIKVDCGYHRTGLGLDHVDLMDQLIEKISQYDQLNFSGMLAHAGHSYKAKGHSEIELVHEESLRVMQQLKKRYQAGFPNLVYSLGDTPTCSIMNTFPGIDEIRPGNFVFYDLSQYQIGSCQLEQIAVAMACPVVAKHADRSEIIVYGGGVHFSKDSKLLPTGDPYYGLVVPFHGSKWRVEKNYGYLKSISQEHGIVKASPSLFEKAQIGDLIFVLPIHSCMTADVMKQYYTLEGHFISMMRYF